MAKPGIRNNLKFKKLCYLLKMPGPHVLGHLEYLWHVAHQSDCPIIGTSLDIEIASEWYGEPGKFFEALRDCGGKGQYGFIEPVETEDDVWQVHDFHEHKPGYLKDRVRKQKQRVTGQSRDNAVTVTGQSRDCPLPSLPSPTKPFPSREKEETPLSPLEAKIEEKPTGPPIRPRTPPEFDNDLVVVWDRLDAVAQASGAFSAKLGLTQARRYALRRALDEIGGDADRLVAGFRWCLTAPAAEFVRDNWRGIDTYLAADKTMGYVEASEARNAWREQGARAGPAIESVLDRLKREAIEAEARKAKTS